MKDFTLNRGPIWFLRGTIILMGVPALFLFFYGFPRALYNISGTPYAYDGLLYFVFAGFYVSIVAYAHALYHAFRLVNVIQERGLFSFESTPFLKALIKDALIIAGIFLLLAVPLYIIAELDDAPGVLLLGMIVGYGSLTVAAFAHMLKRQIETFNDSQ